MTALVQHQQPSESNTVLSPRNPVTMQQPQMAKNVLVYMNGDQHNPARKFVINRRYVSDFDGFLTMVTNRMKPSFGAVRKVYTPMHGHPVTGLEDIDNGMHMVAGGVEKFKPLHYKDIIAPKRLIAPKRFNYYEAVRPVLHNTRMNNIAARWRDNPKGPCNIYVYINGDVNTPAIRILLIPRIMKFWELVLQEITEKVAHRSGRAVRRLHNLHGELLNGPEQLESGVYYVACGTEKFKAAQYGDVARHMAESRNKKPHHLPPLRRRVRTLNSKPLDPTYSHKYAARREFEEHRQQQSQPPLGERPPPNRRRLRPIKGAAPPLTSETDSVFHAKPVKVKRSGGGKLTSVSTADENENDVFRARREEVKAEEVADDEDTKVDLPIDQVPADTVEDEEDLDVPVKHEEPEKRDKSPEPKETYATRLEEDDSEITGPSKTPTSANREDPFPSARTVEQTEPNGSVVQPADTQQPEEKKEEEGRKTKSEDEAAVIIQSAYKGYAARKELKQRKNAPESERPKFTENPEAVATDENDAEYGDHIDRLPLSESRAETPDRQTPLTQDPIQQEQENADDKPGSPNDKTPTPNEIPLTDSPVTVTEEPPTRDTPRRSPTPTEDQPEVHTQGGEADTISTTQEVPQTKPDDVDEAGPQTPINDETTIEASGDPASQPAPRQENEESADVDVTASKDEIDPGLPERDAGDGTEENGARERGDEIENEIPQINGNVSTGDANSQSVKTSQEMNGRSSPITGDENVEQPQKSQLEEGQIPNGQPTTITGEGV